MEVGKSHEGLEWQIGVWDQISDVYLREIDRRFVPVVDGVITRAELKPGETILDLGTGTGAVAIQAGRPVGPDSAVTGVDISPDMLRLAERRAARAGLNNIQFREGRAETIPAEDSSFDVVLASLSLMYVIDRVAAAKEIVRVLRPGGRLVAAVWAAPEKCDIVRFQQTAGSFAPKPPVANVGPGAMADPTLFVRQLAEAGLTAKVETQELGFVFDSFALAWEVAGVTTARLDPDRIEEAKEAVRQLMWQKPNEPRHFRNVTQFIVGSV
jgi:SAM-dependent methyltransferase